jgi:hypothetical protein
MKEIVDGIVDDIISHRKGEMYDEDEDPYEATDNFFADFLGDVRYLVDKEMEKYIDEDGNIRGE